jgi:catechol 2,3-dioxygenase-like lactoylglutathione lyase family enzyme
MTGRRAAVIIYAADLPRLQGFYESVCGLKLVEADPNFVMLVSDAWELTLVAISDKMAATFELTDPPTRRSGTPIKLAFEIASLPETRSAAKAAGGTVDDAEWTSRAIRCATVKTRKATLCSFVLHLDDSRRLGSMISTPAP